VTTSLTSSDLPTPLVFIALLRKNYEEIRLEERVPNF